MAITESTINSLEFQSKLTGELDKALVQSAQTSFFADNAMRSKFVGARTVLIPDVDMQGLGNYDRDNGFVTGALTVWIAAAPSSLTERTTTKPVSPIWPDR